MTHKVYRAVDTELTVRGRPVLERLLDSRETNDIEAAWAEIVAAQSATLAKGDEVRFVDGKIEVTT